MLIVDHGDNTGSGGSADDMSVLAEMLRQGLSGIIVAPIRDPEAVDQLINCGEGNETTLTVGGKYSVPSINQIGRGLNCTGIVKKITDGCFTITSPVQTGLKVCLGRTVVFDIGPATIVITEEGWEPYGPELFMHGGLIPEGKSVLCSLNLESISGLGLNQLLITLLWQQVLVSVVQITLSLIFLDFQNQCFHLTKK